MYEAFIPRDQEDKPRAKCYEIGRQGTKKSLQYVDERSVEYDLLSYRNF